MCSFSLMEQQHFGSKLNRLQRFRHLKCLVTGHKVLGWARAYCQYLLFYWLVSTKNKHLVVLFFLLSKTYFLCVFYLQLAADSFWPFGGSDLPLRCHFGDKCQHLWPHSRLRRKEWWWKMLKGIQGSKPPVCSFSALNIFFPNWEINMNWIPDL